jgi:competence protein ComEC
MAVLSLYAVARTKEYDGLSALSIAASLLLIISPLELFNISFVLSFVSVLSIILVMPVLNRLLSNVFYDKLAGTLALNFAVQLGLFVTQVCYFGKVPVLSFFTNLITVPLASFAFMFFICALILTLILPFAAPVMNLFGIIMQLLVRFNNFVSGIAITIDVGILSGFAVLLSLVMMFVVSDYVFVKKRTKTVLSLITLALIVSLMII